MKLTHENLILVTRDSADFTSREILVGKKRRGPLEGIDAFPGGKLIHDEDQPYAASRKLREETGLEVAPADIRAIGRIIINDMRETSRRFGYISLFRTDVGRHARARITEELEPRWVDIRDASLTGNMHPDTQTWWPYALNDATPISVHVMYDPDGELEVIVKEPDALRRGHGGLIYDEQRFGIPDFPRGLTNE